LSNIISTSSSPNLNFLFQCSAFWEIKPYLALRTDSEVSEQELHSYNQIQFWLLQQYQVRYLVKQKAKTTKLANAD